MNGLRCITSMVQFLTNLSIAFLLFVIVYFAFTDGRASVITQRPDDAMISIRKTDGNGDYDTSKGKVPN